MFFVIRFLIRRFIRRAGFAVTLAFIVIWIFSDSKAGETRPEWPPGQVAIEPPSAAGDHRHIQCPPSARPGVGEHLPEYFACGSGTGEQACS